MGGTLHAQSEAWPDGWTTSYEWNTGGYATSETDADVVIPAAWVGSAITVTIHGVGPEGEIASSTSAPTAAVLKGVLVTATPTITGSVASGHTLTAHAGTWTAGTAFSYQWYASGKAISGATKSTYKVSSTQYGKTIKVKVTGSLPGYTSMARTSSSTAKATKAGAATITGAAWVSHTVTAKPGTWATGTKLSYQWYADGKAISGATKSTYTITSGKDGKQITVRVTGKKSGYATVAKTSAATKRVMLTTAPTITGSTKVTKTLTAHKGTWSSGATVSYQWYANGKAISGATKSTLTLKSAYKGKKISVKITGKKSGYTTVTRTSKATKVITYPSRITATSWDCPSWAPIKGNYSTSSGDLIYHVPGGRWYDVTNPEECFSSVSAAKAAGYRASRNG